MLLIIKNLSVTYGANFWIIYNKFKQIDDDHRRIVDKR